MIVGGSCRAAAQSAAAAGWDVHAADLFADLDLEQATVSSQRVSGYPEGLVDAAALFPPAPWCYTGALENHPDLINRLAALRPLAGNSGDAVRRVRNPATLAPALRTAGLLYPDTHGAPGGITADGSFLRKPLASAGGRGMKRWTAAAAENEPPGTGVVWQRWVDGTALAAIFALADGASRLLGVSRQLVGEPWCRAAAFAYCGSIQIPSAGIPEPVLEQLQCLGALLAGEFELAGIVGVDLVLDAADRITVIEVNPRPTASAELIERAAEASVLATHLAAFGLRSPVTRPPSRRGDAPWSKAILFAHAPVAVDDRKLERLRLLSTDWSTPDGLPALADIPHSGQTLRAGAPVLTVFARGDSSRESLDQLQCRLAAVKTITG